MNVGQGYEHATWNLLKEVKQLQLMVNDSSEKRDVAAAVLDILNRPHGSPQEEPT